MKKKMSKGNPKGNPNWRANQILVEQAEKVLRAVHLEGYTFEVRKAHGGVILRASYMEPDVYTGKDERQYTRKWLLSPHMTESEIVQTAFKCAATSFEHRVREHFLYHGRRVFGPHFRIRDLWMLCGTAENAGGRV